MKINGITFTDPSSAELSYENVDKAERNALATMLIDGVALKKTYALKWPRLLAAEAKSMLEQVTSVTSRIVPIEFTDPLTGTAVSCNFYTGASKKMNIGKIVGGLAEWVEDVSFSIIEQ